MSYAESPWIRLGLYAGAYRNTDRAIRKRATREAGMPENTASES